MGKSVVAFLVCFTHVSNNYNTVNPYDCIWFMCVICLINTNWSTINWYNSDNGMGAFLSVVIDEKIKNDYGWLVFKTSSLSRIAMKDFLGIIYFLGVVYRRIIKITTTMLFDTSNSTRTTCCSQLENLHFNNNTQLFVIQK